MCAGSADRACAGRIAQLISEKLRNRLLDFEVVVASEGLVLKGRSRTYYVKQLAQQLVMRTTDLPIAANRIEVIGNYEA
jgi:hypothetical protein